MYTRMYGHTLATMGYFFQLETSKCSKIHKCFRLGLWYLFFGGRVSNLLKYFTKRSDQISWHERDVNGVPRITLGSGYSITGGARSFLPEGLLNVLGHLGVLAVPDQSQVVEQL